MANILPFLHFGYPFYPRFQYPFIPVPDTLFIPFRYPFYPRFLYPFYPRFPYTFYRRSKYTFYPRFQYTFIPVSDPTLRLSSAISSNFLPPPPLPPSTHVLCPVPNVRIPHNNCLLECISHLLSRGTRSPVGRGPLMTLAKSIVVVIQNKGAAMCTRQSQYMTLIITTHCLLGTGTLRC